MVCGFFYLVAIIDWFSRAVLAWRLSNTMDALFCVEALEVALARFGEPEIFNSAGRAVHRAAFTTRLEAAGITITCICLGREPAVDMIPRHAGRGLDNARALPTCPQPPP